MDPYKHRPTSGANSGHWTTNYGASVWNNNSALTVGNRGPILLEDYHLIEKLAQFDREPIPELATIIWEHVVRKMNKKCYVVYIEKWRKQLSKKNRMKTFIVIPILLFVFAFVLYLMIVV